MAAKRGTLGRLTILLGVWTLSVGSASAAPRAYERLREEAMKAEGTGQFEQAYLDFQKLHQLAPDSPYPSYDAASCAARLGRKDDAFEWLGKAVDAGYQWPDETRADDRLETLRDDPRWPPLLEGMQAGSDRNARLWRARRPDPDIASAPVFKSYKKLAAAFDRRKQALEEDQLRLSPSVYESSLLVLSDERCAAARKYIADHPRAKDLDVAAWDAVASRPVLSYPYYLVPRWGEAGVQALEEIDAFLAAYSASPLRADARTFRALAIFHARPEGGTKSEPWAATDLQTLATSLHDVAQQFPGTTAGGVALAWSFIFCDMLAVNAITPEMRAMRAELDSVYAHDRGVQKLMAVDGRPATLRMDGVAEFDGTDLSGHRWNAASFAGRVTLIDFWATWCGPCVGEIPTVRKAWTEFHEQGLRVLGVSLDFDDRKSFEAWLRANDVSWPQIWDGRGFSTPLARKFDVRSIPTSVLINAGGRVVNVGLRGEALIARIRELIEQAPPVSNP